MFCQGTRDSKQVREGIHISEGGREGGVMFGTQ